MKVTIETSRGDVEVRTHAGVTLRQLAFYAAGAVGFDLGGMQMGVDRDEATHVSPDLQDKTLAEVVDEVGGEPDLVLCQIGGQV